MQGNEKEVISDAKEEIKNIASKLNIENYVRNIYFKAITNINEEFNDIWKSIKNLAPKQLQWEMDVPTQWMQMERFLQQLANGGTPLITYGQMLTMCPPNFDQPTLFIKYMRASGLVVTLHQGAISPDDEIVIDPQWVIDAFKQVIDLEEPNHARSDEVLQIQKGKLTTKAVNEVWEPEQFRIYKDVLPKIMESLGLIAAPEGETRFHYIPSLLPSDTKKLNKEIAGYSNERTMSRSYVLDFRKKGVQVPFPHFDKLMAKLISGQTKQSVLHVSRYGCIAMMEDRPLGFVVCFGCSVVKLTLFSKRNLDEPYVRRTSKKVLPELNL